MIDTLPSFIILDSGKRKLLELLSDSKWHRKFLGISVKTFDLMQELGFVRMRFYGDHYIEARITIKGRFLLKRGQCNLRYERNPKARNSRRIQVVEMEKDLMTFLA